MSIGETTLDLLHPCERCVIPTRDPDTQERWADLLRHLTREHSMRFGINARPRAAATLRVGDAVSVAYNERRRRPSRRRARAAWRPRR